MPNIRVKQESRTLPETKVSGIRILNEPLNDSSAFLVETGESRTPRPKEAARDMLQA